MRFTEDNVNVETLQNTIELLTGEVSELELLGKNDLPELEALLSIEENYRGVHLRKAPDQEFLDDMIHDSRMLFVWRIFPKTEAGRGSQAGFVFWVNYAGPPFIYIVPTSPEFDLDIMREAAQQVLYFYLII